MSAIPVASIRDALQLLEEIARLQQCDNAIANLISPAGISGHRDLVAADRGRIYQLMTVTNAAINDRIVRARALLEHTRAIDL